MKHAAGDDRNGVVVRIVEDLDLQSLARPIQGAHSVKDPIGHIAFVVDRHLDADARLPPRGDRLMNARMETSGSPREEEEVGSKRKERDAGQPDRRDRDYGDHQAGSSNSV